MWSRDYLCVIIGCIKNGWLGSRGRGKGGGRAFAGGRNSLPSKWLLLRIEKARRACCFSLRPPPILRVDPPTDLLVTQRFCVTHAARELSHRLINAPGCCWDAMGQCRTRCSRFNYAECWLLVTDTGIMTRLERDHMYVRCKW